MAIKLFMKQYIILTIILSPFFASASFDRDLFYGLRQDPQVTELQEFLTTQGVYSGPVTGNFFSLTLKAVKDFQTANLISPTGYFGPLTRAKSNSLLSAVTDESGTSISPAITPPKTTDDLVAKLTEQITILQQQLAELQKQQAVLTEQNQKLGAIQIQVTEQQQTLTQIQTNTAPPAPTPPPPPPPPPIDKSEMLITTRLSTPPEWERAFYGIYWFQVQILDEDGKFVQWAVVTMDTPEGNLAINPPAKQSTSTTTGCETNRCTNWYAGFGYRPPNLGLNTITFKSGNFTKNWTIEVSQ